MMEANSTLGECHVPFLEFNCTGPGLEPTDQALVLSILILFIAATIIGNLLIVCAVLRFRQLQTRTNAVTTSLAVADLMVGAVIIPCSMTHEVYRCWFFGQTFCRIHYFMDYWFTNASILHLGCIAFDRYVAICDPLRYQQRVTNHTVVLMLLMCWLCSALFSAPILISLSDVLSNGVMDRTSCPDECVFIVNLGLTFLIGICPYFLSLFILSLAYAKIFRVARVQASQIHAAGKHGADSSSSASIVGDANSKRTWLAMKREHNAAKTLGMIIGFFLLSWLPFYVISVVDVIIDYQTNAVLRRTVTWVGYFSSAVNPVLYASFNRPFRNAFRDIVSCRAFAVGARNKDLFGS
uniref:Dopamine receptor 2-like n=1 Tax=Petromyzon marinus TaxID=7757 RepID=A0A678XJQ8_PETMA|nr:dopamine receptor 2-like [Petromyzon marinus]AZK36087.1 trace amine-associated receptor 9665.TAAR351 [Petromyzon marinus]